MFHISPIGPMSLIRGRLYRGFRHCAGVPCAKNRGRGRRRGRVRTGNCQPLTANRQPLRGFLKTGDPFAEREPFFLSLHFPDLHRFPVEDHG